MNGIIYSVAQEKTKTNSSYCKVTLLTPTKVTVNVWGCTAKQMPLHQQFYADVKINDKGISCNYSDVKLSSASEEQLSWIPKPPSYEEWLELIQELKFKMVAYGGADKEINFFEEQAQRLYKPFSLYPAGKSNHHAFKGGLAKHTYEILSMFNGIYNNLPFPVNPFIVSISALFHDAAKIRCYEQATFEYTPYGSLVNHVAGSATMLSTLMRQSNLPERLITYCEHCVLAHHGRLEWGSPVLPSCIEAHVLALLDELSGHGTQIVENATPEGTRVPNLGRTVFSY